MTGVNLNNVIKKYGETQVIHGVDLQIEDGEFCVFVGPSGCGKSTLLRMIAGLEETTGGSMSIGDRDVTDMDPSQRGVAMVFQTYALYPHMTVEENMGFGLKMNGVPKAIVKEKVGKASDILKLDDYLKRKPKALSGGQRQRVAIGRAIVRGPEVFLFDEPLSNLDAELRVEMRVEIARLHNEIGATMIYVTHDQVEAMTMADRMIVMNAGIAEQIGTPLEVYETPRTLFAAQFIGSPSMNVVDAQVKGATVFLGDQSVAVAMGAEGPVKLGVRPEHLVLDDDGPIQMKVKMAEPLGANTLLHGVLVGTTESFTVSLQGVHLLSADNMDLSFSVQAGKAHLFDADTGLRRTD